MSDPFSACANLLTLIEGILGPDRIDQLREQLVAELGPDVALPAMRIIRPHLERLRDAQTEEWRSMRREVRADIDGAARVRKLHQPETAKRVQPCDIHEPQTVCSSCEVIDVTVCSHPGCHGWPCKTIAALDPPKETP